MGLFGGGDDEVKVKLGIIDNTKDALQGFQNSFGKMVGAVGLGTLAADAFRKGMSMVESQISGTIKAAMDEQVAMGKVDAILKTMSGSFDNNKKATEEASKAAMKLGFDDEDAAISMARLLQVTNDQKTAQLAMSDAMDLSRLKGIDLESATKMTTMAYAGNVKVLKEMYGIDLPEGAKGLEALGLMHERVAGQADAFANTAAGAQERFKVATENVQEQIGGMFLPIITQVFTRVSEFLNGEKLSGWLSQISSFVNDQVMPAFRNIGRFLVDVLWPALRDNITPAFKVAYEAIKPHLPLLADIAKWIGIIAGGAFVGALIIVSNTIAFIVFLFSKMLDIIKSVWNFIKDVVEWVGKAIDKFQQLGDKIPDWLKSSPAEVIGNLLPKFDVGGIVPGSIGAPMPAIVHGGELIIPANQVASGNYPGGGITINVNNPVVREAYDITRIVDRVSSAINRSVELRGLRA